jgi:hypothetical protein
MSENQHSNTPVLHHSNLLLSAPAFYALQLIDIV